MRRIVQWAKNILHELKQPEGIERVARKAGMTVDKYLDAAASRAPKLDKALGKIEEPMDLLKEPVVLGDKMTGKQWVGQISSQSARVKPNPQPKPPMPPRTHGH